MFPEKMKQTCRMFRLAATICPYLFFSEALSSLLSIAQTMTYIFLPKQILDGLLDFRDWNTVLRRIGLFVGLIALFKAVDLLTRPWRNACTNRAGVDTMEYYMALAARTRYADFEGAAYRDTLQTALSQVRGETAVRFCVQIGSSLLSLLIYAVFIWGMHPLLFLILLLAVTARTVAKFRENKLDEKTIPSFRQVTRKLEYIENSFLSFQNAKEVRTNEVEGLARKKYRENIEEMWDLDTRCEKKRFSIHFLRDGVSAAARVLLYGYAAMLTLAGRISIGSFSAYLASAEGTTGAVCAIIDALLDFHLKLRFVPLHDKLTSLAEEMENEGWLEKIDAPLEIQFENVSFRYPNTERNVLENINFTLSPGRKVAIVGENGAGKTTFIKLLCRLYKPTSGRITIGGRDIEEFSPEAYGKLLSVVFQDFKLFSLSVAENIVLNLEHEDDRLREVIDKADLRTKIENLPAGVETYVNKEFETAGVEFSGGEAEKLALARAYYKNSPIVILDEPTAALDPLSEQYLYDHFRSIIGDHSAIFISHRLAATAFCDRILVFSGGRIAEEGTHEELLRKDGVYSKMWKLQATLYRGAEENENEK